MAIKGDSVRLKTMKKKSYPVTYVLSFGQNREEFWKEFIQVWMYQAKRNVRLHFEVSVDIELLEEK